MPSLFSIRQIKLHFAQPPDLLRGRSINLLQPPSSDEFNSCKY